MECRGAERRGQGRPRHATAGGSRSCRRAGSRAGSHYRGAGVWNGCSRWGRSGELSVGTRERMPTVNPALRKRSSHEAVLPAGAGSRLTAQAGTMPVNRRIRRSGLIRSPADVCAASGCPRLEKRRVRSRTGMVQVRGRNAARAAWPLMECQGRSLVPCGNDNFPDHRVGEGRRRNVCQEARLARCLRDVRRPTSQLPCSRHPPPLNV